MKNDREVEELVKYGALGELAELRRRNAELEKSEAVLRAILQAVREGKPGVRQITVMIHVKEFSSAKRPFYRTV